MALRAALREHLAVGEFRTSPIQFGAGFVQKSLIMLILPSLLAAGVDQIRRRCALPLVVLEWKKDSASSWWQARQVVVPS